jgi:ABC-2 type transport system ATP-binding protein
MGEPAIRVDNLVKTYGHVRAVDGISFEVAQGSIFGFLGPNGAGKTTTINVLCTLLDPTSGSATISGHDCRTDPAGVRQNIGLVFQDTTLDKDLTAYENLAFHAILYSVPRAEVRRRVEEALRFIDLYDRKDDLVRKFSGGMKRRLEVARGLIHRPKVLFLDEPTLGLDPQSRASLWESITSLPAEHDVTIFMTTHYMEEAEVCDSIAVIDGGRIIAEGSPEELKQSVGGDVIAVRTTDNALALDVMRKDLGMEPILVRDEIHVTACHGDRCVQDILRTLADRMLSIELKRPTLNDVFLKLTGKAIRDEEAGSHESIKSGVRAYRRRHGRG